MFIPVQINPNAEINCLQLQIRRLNRCPLVGSNVSLIKFCPVMAFARDTSQSWHRQPKKPVLRASVPTISTSRRGSLSGQLPTEVTPKAKGSNGALTPSIKERKKSR
uniref:Uncharacterized protein n=1 Tax=Magallana gigas TaxID=29159 RepID=A0A8W8IBI9_MAGGI